MVVIPSRHQPLRKPLRANKATTMIVSVSQSSVSMLILFSPLVRAGKIDQQFPNMLRCVGSRQRTGRVAHCGAAAAISQQVQYGRDQGCPQVGVGDSDGGAGLLQVTSVVPLMGPSVGVGDKHRG
jgi:hypothetical protein